MACGRSNFIYPVAGYMRVIRRRTLTKWTNVHLETVGVSVEDVIDLLDSGTVAKLLSVLSGRHIAVPIFQPQRKKRQQVGWRNICSFLASQEFPEDVIGKNLYIFSRFNCVTEFKIAEITEIEINTTQIMRWILLQLVNILIKTLRDDGRFLACSCRSICLRL